MYRDLNCQHHLVQERNDQRPDIPSLPPVGFEGWMTLLIQAHPKEEYRRLQKAVLHMPVSNPDKRKVSKGNLPAIVPPYEDREIREPVENAISKHANIQLPRHLNRKEPQSYRDTLFHTSSAGKQIYNPQNCRHRHVSFVLPTDIRSNTLHHFEEPTYKGAERARRQPDEDVRSYGESP